MRLSIIAALLFSVFVSSIANVAEAELFTLDFDNDGTGEVDGSDDRTVSFTGTVTTVNGGAVDALIRAVDLSQVDPADIAAFAGVAPDFANQDVFVFDVVVTSPSAPIDQVLVGIGTSASAFFLDPDTVGYFLDGLAAPSFVAIQSGFGLAPGAARFDFGFGGLGADNLEAGEVSVRLFLAYNRLGPDLPLSSDQVASFVVSSGLDEDFQSDIGSAPGSLALLGIGLLGVVLVRRGRLHFGSRTLLAGGLLPLALVVILGLSLAPVARAQPDLSFTGVFNEDDGLLGVCNAPCFSIEKRVEVFLDANPSAPGVCPAGSNTYVYTLAHLGGSGVPLPSSIPPLTQFEVEFDVASVTSAGFIPGPDVSPSNTALSSLGVVRWEITAPPLVEGQATNALFVCSPDAPVPAPGRRTSALGVLLHAPGSCLAPACPVLLEPEIDVVPLAVDFADTAVGSTSVQLVTITNIGTSDLTIASVDLAVGSDAAFAIDSAPADGTVLVPNDSADVELAFTPVDGSAVAGILEIASDDADEPLVQVALAGQGVPADEQIMEILEFFDSADIAATQGNRDVGMRNLLESAGDFIDRGQTEQACEKLADALLRVDGIEPPDPPPVPDFVEGPDAEALAAEIEELRDNLDCDAPKSTPGRRCGIGFELAFLLPPLVWLSRRRRRRR